MTEHQVVIAGGGPTGMMLAAELALANVDVAVVERRPDHVLVGSRAGGFHSRTIEVLDQRGIADRFLAEGKTAQAAIFGTTVLDMSDFPTRHPVLARNLAEPDRADHGHLARGAPRRIHYGQEERASPRTRREWTSSYDAASLRAQYLVGCDGGRSVIRRGAGIDFPGWDPTRSTLIAEVELTEEPPKGVHFDASGAHGLNMLEDGRTVRVVTTTELESARTASPPSPNSARR